MLFTTHNYSNITRVHAKALGWRTLPTCCHLLGPPKIYTFKTSIQLYICLILKCFGISHGKIGPKPWMSLGMPVQCCRVHHSLLFPYMSGFASSNWAELWNKMEVGVICVPFQYQLSALKQLSKHCIAAPRIIFKCTGCTCKCFLRAGELNAEVSGIPWGCLLS